MTTAQLTSARVAKEIGVDPKTVERWVTRGRVPHRTHRWAVAALLGTDEVYLWPDTFDESRVHGTSKAELVTIYPHRGAVPPDLWRALLGGSRRHLDVLVYAGLFLFDGYPELHRFLTGLGERGGSARVLLGDPESDVVRRRGEEEGVGEGMAARIRLSLAYLQPALHSDGIELRLHRTTLYNSLFRCDDDLLVNTHAYGAPASRSPVLHLRRLPGGQLFEHYQQSFERVWEQATAPDPQTGGG